MSEDTKQRFYLVERLMRMRYGDSYKMDGDKAHMAWPPTGDHDRSIEGAMRAMALASGGNRPESSYTTPERILNDLDGTFEVVQDDRSRDWIIHRRLEHCPKCKGRGDYQQFTVFEGGPELVDVTLYAAVPATDVVSYRWVSCDHRAS